VPIHDSSNCISIAGGGDQGDEVTQACSLGLCCEHLQLGGCRPMASRTEDGSSANGPTREVCDRAECLKVSG
jgi:hypothetical protein